MRRSIASLGVIVAAALTLAACSSSGTEPTTAPTDGGGSSQLMPPPPTTPPTTITSTIPLSETPPEGITVALVRTTTAQWDFFGSTFEAAADALGWEIKTYPYTTDQAGALQQAINGNPDYIVGGSLLVESLTTQLAEAKEKGIPFLNSGGNGVSDPENDYYELQGVGTPYTTQLADWIINDSEGTANVVYVTPLVFPYFQNQNVVLGDYIAENCPDCAWDTLDITLEALGAGQVPSLLVSYLQTHPNIDYVYFGFDSLTPGVVPALKSAGIHDSVKLTGIGATGPQLQEIIDGDQAAWIAIPSETYGWAVLDIFTRLSVGDDVGPTLDEYLAVDQGAPTWVIESAEEAEKFVDEPFGWPGPDNYEDQFKTLWQLN